ncbi:MAG TPA: Gfo/Idh/MocA family oxidoreductase [Bacteroidales bacterium]|jgi:predicted dehydrogenase|nr:Gfo/Idh/MocA family oxidoreductase [Bacteroidales bacterium]HOF17173.1 Gfo/Idh/MocA family oxidoreductase [Bacteroidales bacterium]HON20817.1 Gfo/Idh/MocA family oxidoreductase [Bacteroidales bacterium]HOR82102.1 Gfo/Idh/MocA family oxidoreductase [Bacteroidales bacterium]HPJ90435.1 Gfo/Idh/MocA family oxidoreductase [Bacteroidales bacterium]
MLKIGVFGAGHLGNIHLNCLKNVENVTTIGFYDPNVEIRKEIAEKHGIPAYDDPDALIQACDIIDIVTPTVSHHEIAMKALREKKHVFIEKPITATLQEAKEILDFSEKHHLKVQIGHVERFNNAFLAAKPYINNPMFIECHRLSEFNLRGTDVSVVLDLMIHDIDIILHTVKSPIKHISASGVAIVSDTPDIANARIEFENGCTANLTASRISMKSMRRMRMFQKNAYITVDFLEKQANIIRIRDYQPEDEKDLLPLIIDLGKEKGKKRIFIESPPKENINAIEMELSLFVQSILDNTACEVSVEDGYYTLDVAYQIMDKFISTKPIV